MRFAAGSVPATGGADGEMGSLLLATFCCGMCGGLAAVRKGYDIFAILVTTWLTALGGGIIRDVLLHPETIPAWHKRVAREFRPVPWRETAEAVLGVLTSAE